LRRDACVGKAEPCRKCAKGDDHDGIEVTLNRRIGAMVFGRSKTSDCKLTKAHSGKAIQRAVRRDKMSHPRIESLVLLGAKEGKYNTIL